jgi:hypothetical protein
VQPDFSLDWRGKELNLSLHAGPTGRENLNAGCLLGLAGIVDRRTDITPVAYAIFVPVALAFIVHHLAIVTSITDAVTIQVSSAVVIHIPVAVVIAVVAHLKRARINRCDLIVTVAAARGK